ncbi:uncharacterized protein LOC134187996 isoform X2 [Corticium candelabrum]|uniref:uncharacterized protein LOC134187996 isoform X2 n=1 Tax=Corticium candelabrum TaxID=121492 RepID=UPI002E2670E7|nr:uncharacterized protein LOC134187996 isoform X2 [Corticium candelabrum]
MHILLEGVITREIRLLLQHCFSQRYFTLVTLNQQMKYVDLGYNEGKDRPTQITRDAIDRDDKLGQRAAQSWCLAVNLPIFIAEWVPADDEHYYSFLPLLVILAICVATTVTTDDACLLATMIEDHHHRFCQLYPGKTITPKMYYMVHLPSQLLSFGPLQTMWCMRFEAKNGHFKRLVKENFKNIPYSLAKQAQLYMCHHLLSSPDGSLSYLAVEDLIHSDFANHPLAEQLSRYLGSRNQTPLWVLSAKGLTRRSVIYKKGSVVKIPALNQDIDFTFTTVDLIIVAENEKYFVVRCLEICSFSDHFYLYEVQPSAKTTLVSCNSLIENESFCIRKVGDMLLVTELLFFITYLDFRYVAYFLNCMTGVNNTSCVT